jgi:hypothetical protein
MAQGPEAARRDTCREGLLRGSSLAFAERATLERDDFSPNRHPALAYWWSVIFSEDRFPLFGIML